MNPVSLTMPNHRILVVDDNPAIHEDIRKVLRGQVDSHDLQDDEAVLFGASSPESTRFEIDSAYQGEEALDKVQKALAGGRPYAVAFVDVRMPPGWDGIETIGHIHPIDPHLQTVICTAYADYSWKDMANRLGRSDHWMILKKPYDNLEVIQLAHALCQKWRATRQAEAQMAELDQAVAQRTFEARVANERYRVIAENASDGILTVSRETIEFANPAAAGIFGCSVEDLRGRCLSDLVPDAGRHLGLGFAVSHPDGYRSIELTGRHASGRDLILEISFSGILNFGGRSIRTAIVRDVTERRRAQRAAAQTSKLESIGRLASGIAHEINTPIQYIGDNLTFMERSYTALDQMFQLIHRISEAGDSHETRFALFAELQRVRAKTRFDHFLSQTGGAIQEAMEGVQQVASIVRAMHEFAHPGRAEMSPTDVNRLLENVILISRNKWKHAAEIALDLDPALPHIPAASSEISQVFLNLITNAADAIADGAGDSKTKGRISISSSRQGDSVVVQVGDSGHGIPEGLHNKIFDPFFTTKDIGRGSGQGLAIAHTIVVKRHGGSIDFETAVGKGTTFTVRLPFDQTDRASDSGRIEGSGSSPDAPPTAEASLAGGVASAAQNRTAHSYCQ